ncbi:hypothetical protein QFZ77_003058 [Paenibacillus sp. V4I3]|nr:hypothetical protein [Paenibacillus sp. V4I3]MDQ0889884.1 hypothetical protein [Paenibacillus sp. V4I9]
MSITKYSSSEYLTVKPTSLNMIRKPLEHQTGERNGEPYEKPE